MGKPRAVDVLVAALVVLGILPLPLLSSGHEIACADSIMHPAPFAEMSPLCDTVVWLEFVRDDSPPGSTAQGAVPVAVIPFVNHDVWPAHTSATFRIGVLYWWSRIFVGRSHPLRCGTHIVEHAVSVWDILGMSGNGWYAFTSKLGLCVGRATPGADLDDVCEDTLDMAVRSDGALLYPVDGVLWEPAQCHRVRKKASPTGIGAAVVQPDATVPMSAAISRQVPLRLTYYRSGLGTGDPVQEFEASHSLVHNPWGCLCMRKRFPWMRSVWGDTEARFVGDGGEDTAALAGNPTAVLGDTLNPNEEADLEESGASQSQLVWMVRCSANSYAVLGIGPCAVARVCNIVAVLGIGHQMLGSYFGGTAVLLVLMTVAYAPWWVMLRMFLVLLVHAVITVWGQVSPGSLDNPYHRFLEESWHEVRGHTAKNVRTVIGVDGRQEPASDCGQTMSLGPLVSWQRLRYENKSGMLLAVLVLFSICPNKVGDVATIACGFFVGGYSARFFQLSIARACVVKSKAELPVRILEALEAIALPLLVATQFVAPAFGSLLPGIPFAHPVSVLLCFVAMHILMAPRADDSDEMMDAATTDAAIGGGGGGPGATSSK